MRLRQRRSTLRPARATLLAAAITALCLVAAGAAAAADPAPPVNDPETTVVATVVEASPATAIKPADIAKSAESAGDFALAGTRCWWAQVSRYGKNILGMRLWTYYQRIDWCAKGTRITSHSRKRWGTTSMPGWSWEGNIQSSQSGGVGSSYYESWTQGHFCLAKYFSCVQNQYPVIDMTVRYNGTYSY